MSAALHYRYEPIQIMPCTGVRVVLRFSDGRFQEWPLVAMAVCRVTCRELYGAEEWTENRVCGVSNPEGEGFVVCEDYYDSLFHGYLGPGETLETYARNAEAAL